jgi:hypothetical protein
MTPSGLSDGGAPPSGSAPELAEGLLEVVSTGSGMSVDGADVETRHRLRRTLRILLAARRRDDRGLRRNDS